MNQLILSGILLIVGFITILIATFSGPPGLYEEPESTARLAILEAHPTRWWVSNTLYALAGVVTAAGLALFSLELRESLSAWVLWPAAGAFFLGTAGWVILMARRAIDPVPYFSDYSFSPFTIGLLIFTLIGLLLYGIAFQQAGYPAWLGIGTIAGMALIAGTALVFPARFFASFPPQVFYLFTLAAGIVLVRG